MLKLITNQRSAASLLVAVFLIFASAGDAMAQRSRTSESRSSTKVERARSGSGASTGRSQSRARPPSRSTTSRAGQSRGATSRAGQSRGATSRAGQSRGTTSRAGQSRGTTSRARQSRGTNRGTTAGRSGSRTNSSRATIGSRSRVRDNNRAGRRVVIPSRRQTYQRPIGHRARHRYTPAYFRTQWPRIHVNIRWPWVVRYQRHWAPTYRYRQVIHVQTVIRGNRYQSEVEVETVYRHSVRRATDDYAEIDVEIERLELYQDGQYLGYVDDLPSRLRKTRATVYRDGVVEFDRELFLVGDPYVGFEVISTRAYEGYVLDAYHHSDGYYAGRVDLRRNRVKTIRSSRLFKPHRFDGLVPVSLLPRDEGWLGDYGADAISAVVDDYDWYYGGSASRNAPVSGNEPLRQEDGWEYRTQDGSDITFQRESRIQRVQ